MADPEEDDQEVIDADWREVDREQYSDDDFADHDDEEGDELEWAMGECSMMADGYCGQAGSEYCDFECPFRDDPPEIVDIDDADEVEEADDGPEESA